METAADSNRYYLLPVGKFQREKKMKTLLLALSGTALVISAAPSAAKTYVCTKWDNGICVSTHRVKGTPPYATGYVFGPNYSYTTLSDIPQPVVSYYKLGPDMRYVYSNGYLYEVDPNTYAVTKVIDTYPH
jgi:hypothetical protein